MSGRVQVRELVQDRRGFGTGITRAVACVRVSGPG